ncbi:E3 ubiquitin-protein ligase ZNRF4 [Ornithorhynchus anatinus]|uniref:E3 ubiquitin-protein ligase ZNRF4 n=1 Tax=Ornithorhynchus anatinus TaxID=9258 RepID=UPI0004541DD6|nr:E3 ubiquitin-protein ligase ZNRF4 [Ornithorhynchus anatinus]
MGPGPCTALTLIAAILLLEPPATIAAVQIFYNCNSSMVEFRDMPALFGPKLTNLGLRGQLVEAKPANACQPIRGPRIRANVSQAAIVLIRRFDCTFDLKILHAQLAGYQAAIVYNMHSDELVEMGHVFKDLKQQIQIPAVFVSETAAQSMRIIMHCDRGAQVFLHPNSPEQCLKLGCSLASHYWFLIGFLTLAITVLMLVVIGWRLTEQATGTVPSWRLRDLRARETKACTYIRQDDLCAICLDDYEHGDQLKILPCSHAFHTDCIDPWFAQAVNMVCPVCKQLVPSSDDNSDSNPESSGELGEDDGEDDDEELFSALRPLPNRLRRWDRRGN